ncbi:putative Acetyl esterase (xynC) [Oenococcus oeni]|uniref:alpha/beta hydrolase n=1 Tax=Oenococcus oeni TaxID=1247 RepID=UPI0010B7F014|nr:alpha/beta hydrolase family protein [Oenococcus oeni]SYW05599.1 putative Acetyl esterase (xynC) [Oenococcus oeni]
MAFLQINYHSHVLGKATMMNVILPELDTNNNNKRRDISVLYLLHGMGDDLFSWQRETNIERLLMKNNLAVVMPDTGLGWYTNTDYGLNYFDALTAELFQKVAFMFPEISQKREKHFVAGLSMGGYGAFKLAMSTDYFSYAASLSGALMHDFNFPQMFEMAPKKYWQGVFGDLDKVVGSKNDLFALAKKQSEGKAELPKLFAWIGLEDSLYPANQFAIPTFRKFGYEVNYQTSHGRHEWYYWNKQIEKVLEWLPIDYIKEERLS